MLNALRISNYVVATNAVELCTFYVYWKDFCLIDNHHKIWMNQGREIPKWWNTGTNCINFGSQFTRYIEHIQFVIISSKFYIIFIYFGLAHIFWPLFCGWTGNYSQQAIKYIWPQFFRCSQGNYMSVFLENNLFPNSTNSIIVSIVKWFWRAFLFHASCVPLIFHSRIGATLQPSSHDMYSYALNMQYAMYNVVDSFFYNMNGYGFNVHFQQRNLTG